MSNVEISKLADEAERAFGRFKKRLAREGLKIRGDTDYRTMDGISATAKALREEWLEAEAELEARTSNPTQPPLFNPAAGFKPEAKPAPKKPVEIGLGDGDGQGTVNPLGFLLNVHYRRQDGEIFMFRGYNADDGIYLWFSQALGGLKVDELYARTNFELTSSVSLDELPKADPPLDLPELDDENFLVKRVSPERWFEILATDSTADLKKKNPKASAVVILSDEPYVVTGYRLLDKEGNLLLPNVAKEGKTEMGADAKIYLTHVRTASRDEKGQEGFFTVGKNLWKMTGDANRIVVKVATVAEVIEEAPAPDVDILGYLTMLVEKGHVTRDEEGIAKVPLAPRSYEEAAKTLRPGVSRITGRVDDYEHGYVLELRVDGFEIDGLEELPAGSFPAGVTLREDHGDDGKEWGGRGEPPSGIPVHGQGDVYVDEEGDRFFVWSGERWELDPVLNDKKAAAGTEVAAPKGKRGRNRAKAPETGQETANPGDSRAETGLDKQAAAAAEKHKDEIHVGPPKDEMGEVIFDKSLEELLEVRKLDAAPLHEGTPAISFDTEHPESGSVQVTVYSEVRPGLDIFVIEGEGLPIGFANVPVNSQDFRGSHLSYEQKALELVGAIFTPPDRDVDVADKGLDV